jgi:ubiquinone/menaquinone biosynthesis C-methylase UbiE
MAIRHSDNFFKISSMNILKKYFNYIYKSASNERHANERKSLEHDPDVTFLDLGCREGDNTLTISSALGTSKIIGIDFNQRGLVEASSRGIRAIKADLNYPLPIINESVEVAFASNVIEHLYNPLLFVREINRVLKPKGTVVLDTPNLASWHNIFALLIGIQPFSGPNITNMEDADLSVVRALHRVDHNLPEEGGNVEHSEQELTKHIVVIAYRSLLKLFRENGYQIVSARGFGYFPFPPFLARVLQRLDISHAHHITVKAIKVNTQ